MKWHKKLLIIVLLISFIVGLGSFGISSVSAAAPTTPIPLTPQGDIYLCDSLLRNASFKWTPVAGATGYTIQIATVPDFTSILINYSSANTEVYLGGINLPPGVYYWRVQAYNLDGPSAWSLPLSFHVTLSSPVLVSPSNNGFILPNTIFTWTTCYPFDTEFELSNQPGFPTILIDLNFSASQGKYKGPYVYEYKFYWPLPSGIYWWRVRTKLGTEMSPWVTQPFMIIIPPNIAPTLIAPQDAIISSRSVNLKCSYVNNGDRYQFQICRGNVPLVDAVVFTTSYNFIGEDNTTYCFRVRAGNPVGWGPWSEWRQFTILLPPVAPRIMYPNNNAVFRNNAITIDWTRIDTAETYTLEITDFTTHAVFVFNFTNNTCQFTGEYQHSYGVKVKAINQSGESSWSNAIWFRIEENIPPKIDINSYPQYTNLVTITISGKVYDLESGIDALCWGPNPIPTASDGSFEIAFTLQEGPNSLTIFALDKAGNKTVRTIDIFKDTTSPEIQINNPLYSDSTVIADIPIKGVIKDNLPVTLLINNQVVLLDPNGNFTFLIALNFGPNKVYLKAIDAAGNVTEKLLKISKISPVAKCEFQVGNPIMKVYKINERGDLQEYSREIDPGRGTVPVIVNNRTFVPVRSLIENIDGTVTWVAFERKIVITLPYRSITIELWIGKSWARITDSYGTVSWVEIEKGNPKVTPFIRNDRSYFPLRFIVEALGFKVNWDSVMGIITIEFPLTP
jgi:hypothetical protein